MNSCAVCGSAENAKKCSGCGTVAYCGINHQRKDWGRHKSSCKAWKVITDPADPQRGRFVVATRNIKAGEVILCELPTLVGPRLDPNAAKVCPGCFGKVKNNSEQRCSDCGIKVCTEKCASSKLHSLECGFLQKLEDVENESLEILTPLRFIGMAKKQPNDFKELMTLVSNKEAKKSGPDWENISKMAQKIKVITSEDISQIEEMICILESNSYQLIADQGFESLNGVFIKASMLNHTCFKANSRPTFGTNYQMKIVATENIQSGQEITTNYLEPFHTSLQRRAILLRGKAFECHCQRCLDPHEFGTKASSMKCQSCSKGHLVTQNPQNLSSDWVCDCCQGRISGQEAMEFDRNLCLETKKINRNNLANIEKFINTYSKHLSESHIFLLQWKMWMVEGLNRLPYENSNKEDILVKKLQLIQEVIKGLEKFESTYSYINGVLNIELCDTIVLKLFSLFNQENMVKNVDPFSLLQDAQKAVEVAEIVFKNEEAKSQDHCLKMKVCDLKMSLKSFS